MTHSRSIHPTRVLPIVGLGLLMLLCSPAWIEASDEAARLTHARNVLEEFIGSPDTEVLRHLLNQCAAVAIFPRVLKGAFFIGGKYGTGIMSAKDPESRIWSAPAFFSIGGGSFGFQFGGESIDLILVIMNQRGVDSLLRGKITLGGDLSASAGPVGRTFAAETDIRLTAEIYTYSRSKGLFAGVSLRGAVISEDLDANAAYYGNRRTARDILVKREVEASGEAAELVRKLKEFSGE